MDQIESTIGCVIKSTKNILRIFSIARKWLLLNVKICTHSCHFVVKYKVEKVKLLKAFLVQTWPFLPSRKKV